MASRGRKRRRSSSTPARSFSHSRRPRRSARGRCGGARHQLRCRAAVSVAGERRVARPSRVPTPAR
eukprot:10705195-Lingulodinium_polyedra.AAC.1